MLAPLHRLQRLPTARLFRYGSWSLAWNFSRTLCTIRHDCGCRLPFDDYACAVCSIRCDGSRCVRSRQSLGDTWKCDRCSVRVFHLLNRLLLFFRCVSSFVAETVERNSGVVHACWWWCMCAGRKVKSVPRVHAEIENRKVFHFSINSNLIEHTHARTRTNTGWLPPSRSWK